MHRRHGRLTPLREVTFVERIDGNIGNPVAMGGEKKVVPHIFRRCANAGAGLRLIPGVGENDPPVLQRRIAEEDFDRIRAPRTFLSKSLRSLHQTVG